MQACTLCRLYKISGMNYWLWIIFLKKGLTNEKNGCTGCTLSSAIASNLAKGYDLETSIHRAKDYISSALAAMLDLGEGSGPMNHAFDLKGDYAE